MTVDEAKSIINAFYSAYPGLQKVDVYLRHSQEEIWPHAPTESGKILGAYFPKKGFVAIAATNADTEADLRRTLRHELLGHYGLNTLSRREKRNLLNGILKAKHEPSLRDAWEKIDRAYPKAPPYVKAEELFCLIVDYGFDPYPIDSCLDSFNRICDMAIKAPTLQDLQNISHVISDGLARNVREQVIFPRDDFGQFRLNT